jgi:hypothetical protein
MHLLKLLTVPREIEEIARLKPDSLLIDLVLDLDRLVKQGSVQQWFRADGVDYFHFRDIPSTSVSVSAMYQKCLMHFLRYTGHQRYELIELPSQRVLASGSYKAVEAAQRLFNPL